jgi:hypothetical protein
MNGSLLYLMVTQSDIQFVICLCARFEASPRSSHRTVNDEDITTMDIHNTSLADIHGPPIIRAHNQELNLQ